MCYCHNKCEQTVQCFHLCSLRFNLHVCISPVICYELIFTLLFFNLKDNMEGETFQF